ncbi:maleylpyruvate isomerase family mycothiol-dependent enzyme [Rhodococcus erythropolis]
MALSTSEYWELIHAERSRLAHVLDALTERQWRSASLCDGWTVEHVTAHVTAAANAGRWAWLRSIARAGFDPDKHNSRRLASYLGSTPQETGARFRDSVNLTVAPTKDYAAWLGEVIVHGQDIARPLDITLTPDPVALQEVATFFVAKDFAVNTRTAVAGLRVEASDAAFAVGDGPLVRGSLVSVVMAMAGRCDYLAELDGDGVADLRCRVE